MIILYRTEKHLLIGNDNMETPPIIQIDNVLISLDCLTEKFCCDLEKCNGQCCVEGDAGAPVTLDEIGGIEEDQAREAIRLAANKLPIKCKFVAKQETGGEQS